jgi:MoaA/NifB/PqqE/SkfB family radical SAM enzyme
VDASFAVPLPSKVTIEVTSACNLRCVMCAHGIGAVQRPKHMSEDMVQRMMPLLESGRYFELHGIGEPMLSPAFWRILGLLRERNPEAMVVFNTNMVVLTEEMLDGLAASSVAHINVSLDAATADTYWKIRGADFGRVTGNVARAVASLSATCTTRPKITVNMTVMKENLAEVPMFVRLAHSLGVDGAIVWPINDFGPDDPLMREWETRLRDWHFVYREQLLTDISERVGATIAAASRIANEIGFEFIASNFPESVEASPPVTPADVEHAYRFFLGRQPENEDVIRYHLNAPSIEDLYARFRNSPEAIERAAASAC